MGRKDLYAKDGSWQSVQTPVDTAGGYKAVNFRPMFTGRKKTMSKRVLIADDSMLMRKMVGEVLTDAGWEIVEKPVMAKRPWSGTNKFVPTRSRSTLSCPAPMGSTPLRAFSNWTRRPGWWW